MRNTGGWASAVLVLAAAVIAVCAGARAEDFDAWIARASVEAALRAAP
jgi:hypothetical protein